MRGVPQPRPSFLIIFVVFFFEAMIIIDYSTDELNSGRTGAVSAGRSGTHPVRRGYATIRFHEIEERGGGGGGGGRGEGGWNQRKDKWNQSQEQRCQIRCTASPSVFTFDRVFYQRFLF